MDINVDWKLNIEDGKENLMNGFFLHQEKQRGREIEYLLKQYSILNSQF